MPTIFSVKTFCTILIVVSNILICMLNMYIDLFKLLLVIIYNIGLELKINYLFFYH